MSISRLWMAAIALGCGVLSVASSAAEGGAGGRKEAATRAMLLAEGFGDLRLGLSEKDLRTLLGKPDKQSALVFQGADGTYVQKWQYPGQGVELTMSTGEKKTGAKTIASFTVSAPCAFATKKGIKIGSAESAVRKAYGAYADRDTPAQAGTFVAGSIYGGIIFNFAQGKVSRIFFGAAAE